MGVPWGTTWDILCPSTPLPGCLAGVMVFCMEIFQFQEVLMLGIGV